MMKIKSTYIRILQVNELFINVEFLTLIYISQSKNICLNSLEMLEVCNIGKKMSILMYITFKQHMEL